MSPSAELEVASSGWGVESGVADVELPGSEVEGAGDVGVSEEVGSGPEQPASSPNETAAARARRCLTVRFLGLLRSKLGKADSKGTLHRFSF